ncbi:MAG: ThuA domain-containing protein [Verrucomicrobiales bacterium]|nr:ThuA domain-containing protein [Verrucomicrobiales bacterium]
MKRIIRLCLCAVSVLLLTAVSPAEEKLKLLIIDGQNNHAWKETTPLLEAILEDSGRFDVSVSTSPPAPPRAPRPPKDKKDEAAKAKYVDAMKKWQAESDRIKKESSALWDAWRPDFQSYDVVVSNYNGELWPEPVQQSFEAYVTAGGGFVSVHAADNSFPQWKAYNQMIAVGGWGGRTELSGPYLRFRDGKWTKDMTPGRGGSHGAQHSFLVETRDPEHPITKGLPAKWMQAKDELYDRLRGPAKNVTVVASAYSDESTRGSGEHEPIIMVVDYGKGRCVHTTLGHSTEAMSSVGFQETLKRSCEWAATGKVTFPEVSSDVLTADQPAMRTFSVAEQ